MTIVKRIAAAAVSACLCISFAGCADTTWAFRAGETTITSGMYLNYLISATMEAQSKIDAQSKAEDSKKDLFKQKIEDTDAEEWIKNRAETLCRQDIAVSQKFDELGLTLSDEDLYQAQMQAEYYWTSLGYQAAFEKNGVSQETFTKYIENGYKSNALFLKYYDTDGIEAVDDGELKAYFADHYIKADMITFTRAHDDDGNIQEDEDKAIKEEAEGYLSRAEAGEDFTALYNEHAAEISAGDSTVSDDDTQTAESADQTASDETASSDETAADSTESSQPEPDDAQTSGDAASDADATDTDTDTDTAEALNTHKPFVIKNDSTTYAEEVMDALKDMKPGDTRLVYDDNQYYVLIRYDISADEADFDDNRTSVLSDMKGEDFQAMVEEWAKALKLETNADSIKRYNPKKLDLEA